jgi:predicted transcriptional regulator
MSSDKMVTDHETRQTIYNHILEYPGVQLSVLKKVYNLNESTLRYHLKYLERAKRVLSNLEEGKLHYYPHQHKIGMPFNPIVNMRKHKLNESQKRIVHVISRNPGISQKDLIKVTNFKRFIITYNVSKLIDMGIVRKSIIEKNVCYEIVTDELMHYEILKVLAVKLLKEEIDEDTFNELKEKLE